MVNSAILQLCDWCKRCSSPFPRPQASSVCRHNSGVREKARTPIYCHNFASG